MFKLLQTDPLVELEGARDVQRDVEIPLHASLMASRIPVGRIDSLRPARTAWSADR